MVLAWTSCRLQANTHALSVVQEYATTASTAMAANFGCSGLQQLTPNPDYSCAMCMGNAHTIDSRPQSEVGVGPDKLEEVASFCYLGDMLFAGGGCEIRLLLV